jgi:hypothetical protein
MDFVSGERVGVGTCMIWMEGKTAFFAEKMRRTEFAGGVLARVE